MAELTDIGGEIKAVKGIGGALSNVSNSIASPYQEGQLANILIKSGDVVDKYANKGQRIVDERTELAKGRTIDEIENNGFQLNDELALIQSRQGRYKDMPQDQIYQEINNLHKTFTAAKQEKIDKFNDSFFTALSTDKLQSENLNLHSKKVDYEIQKSIKGAKDYELKIDIAKTLKNGQASLGVHGQAFNKNLDTTSSHNDGHIAISNIVNSIDRISLDGNGNPIATQGEKFEMAQNVAAQQIARATDNGGNPLLIYGAMTGQVPKFDKNGKFVKFEEDEERVKAINDTLKTAGWSDDQIKEYKETLRLVANKKLVEGDHESLANGTAISKYSGLNIAEYDPNDKTKPFTTVEKTYANLGLTAHQQEQLLSHQALKKAKSSGARADKGLGVDYNLPVAYSILNNDIKGLEKHAEDYGKMTGTTKEENLNTMLALRKDFKNPSSKNYHGAVTGLVRSVENTANPTLQQIARRCKQFGLPMPVSETTKGELDKIAAGDHVKISDILSKPTGDLTEAEKGELVTLNSLINPNSVLNDNNLAITKEIYGNYFKNKATDDKGVKRDIEGVFNASMYLKTMGYIDEINPDIMDKYTQYQQMKENNILSDETKESTDLKNLFSQKTINDEMNSVNNTIKNNYIKNVNTGSNNPIDYNNKDVQLILLANTMSKDAETSIAILGFKVPTGTSNKIQDKIKAHHPNSYMSDGDKNEKLFHPNLAKTTSYQKALNEGKTHEQALNMAKEDYARQIANIRNFISDNKDKLVVYNDKLAPGTVAKEDIIIRNSKDSNSMEAVYYNKQTKGYYPVMIDSIPVTYKFQQKQDGTIDTNPTKLGFVKRGSAKIANIGNVAKGYEFGDGKGIGGVDSVPVAPLPESEIDQSGMQIKPKKVKPKLIPKPE